MNLNQAHPELFHLTSAQAINFAYHQQLLMNLNQVHQDLKDHVWAIDLQRIFQYKSVSLKQQHLNN